MLFEALRSALIFSVFSYANVLTIDVNCSLTRTTPALLYSDFPKCNKPQLGGDRASKHWPVDWYYSPSSAVWFIGPTPLCKSLRKIRHHRSLTVGYTVCIYSLPLTYRLDIRLREAVAALFLHRTWVTSPRYRKNKLEMRLKFHAYGTPFHTTVPIFSNNKNTLNFQGVSVWIITETPCKGGFFFPFPAHAHFEWQAIKDK